MQKTQGTIYYSASDVVNFLDCEHLTTLDLINLETPLPKAEEDEETLLYMHKGIAHETSYLAHLQQQGLNIADISGFKENLQDAVKTTLAAMSSGADIIYQASLQDGCFVGHADFLRKLPRPSDLGAYCYEVIDTKLARNAKAGYLVQPASIRNSWPGFRDRILS